MRRWLAVCLLAAFAAPGVWAQGMRPPPSEAETRASALLSRAGPQTRAFVAREARAPGLTEASARQAALSEGAELGATSPGDVDALVAMVMLQASENADGELASIQAQMQQTNAQKQALRAGANQMTEAQGATAHTARTYGPLASPNRIAPQAPRGAPSAVARPASPYAPVQPQVPPDRDGNLDSMNEMSETDSMRVQMAMDRRSKFMEALSNVMKKIEATDAAITQNMK